MHFVFSNLPTAWATTPMVELSTGPRRVKQEPSPEADAEHASGTYSGVHETAQPKYAAMTRDELRHAAAQFGIPLKAKALEVVFAVEKGIGACLQ